VNVDERFHAVQKDLIFGVLGGGCLFFNKLTHRVSSETRFAFCFAKLDVKRVPLFRETNWLFSEISCFAKQPVLHVSLFFLFETKQPVLHVLQFFSRNF
jgi:hypothetical protein